jgi:hypothetical protein
MRLSVAKGFYRLSAGSSQHHLEAALKQWDGQRDIFALETALVRDRESSAVAVTYYREYIASEHPKRLAVASLQTYLQSKAMISRSIYYITSIPAG